MRLSLAFSCSSAAQRACSSALDTPNRSANGDTGEGLVDVHAIELLSVGVEADHPLLAQQCGDRLDAAIVLDLQAAQEAVAADGQQQRTEALLQPGEQLLQVGQQGAGVHGGEHDAVL